MRKDIIYRDDAIEAIKKNTFRLTVAEEQNAEGHVAWDAYVVYSDVAEGALLDLPSVQPEHPMQIGWICPICGRGLSPLTSTCPCNNGKGWEITC